MPARTGMIHVRIDDDLKSDATAVLDKLGLTLSDAVRILLTRIAADGALPASLTATPEAYDSWFRAKIQDVLDNPGPTMPQDQVMRDARARISAKRVHS